MGFKSRNQIAKKITKTPYFGVQGRSRSSMLVPPECSSAVLVIISSKSVSICNRFHARRANSGKITISRGRGVPLFDALVRGESPRPVAPNYLIRNRDCRLSCGEDPESLSHLALNPYRVVTDRRTAGRTDRIAVANTRSQQYLPVQLSRVKIH